MKKFCVFILVGLFFISSFTYAATFKDLLSSHWAYKYITSLTAKNVINGYTDGTFKPEGTITNAEFIKLVVMAGLPDWIDINDAESNLDHWAGTYVWIAERYGIIKTGNYNLSNLDKPITRLEMARIISKADLIMKGNDIATNSKVKFNDVLTLNNDDLMLLRHACSKNLITGYSDNTFKPYNNMTRAEAATMIYRFN